jgi:hypothetical protein
MSSLLELLNDAHKNLRHEFNPDAFNIGINDGPAAGQTVPHLHIHLIPRFNGDVADPRGGVRWLIREKARYWDAPSFAKVAVPLDLPINEGLLSELFSATTTSYKFLLFLSILKSLRRSEFKKFHWELDELVKDMVFLAWHPYSRFMLSLGSQDQLGAILDELPIPDDALDSNAAREIIWNSLPGDSLKQLKRFVPFRLIAPFFREELAGLPDQQKDSLIFQLSRQLFEERAPLYRFSSDEEIEIHLGWLDYLRRNYEATESRVITQFTEYLIRRNPRLPNFSREVFSALSLCM